MKPIITYKNVGEYKCFTSCRFCGSSNIKLVIDLGLMSLAGGFINNTRQKKQEKFYPLQLNFCYDCFLLQANSSLNPDILFKNYFYFSSSIKTLVSHFENTAKDLHKILTKPKGKFIIEIGANDGSFINSLISQGFKALGVDPASNIIKPLIKKGLPIINDYFSESLARKIVKQHGKADAIISFHTLAHIEDMHDVIRGIKILLKDDGFLAFEVHYLGNLIKELQYDMIYHEHQFYYSLHSITSLFKMHEMEIFDARLTPIRSGSIMFFIQKSKTGKRKLSKNVNKIILMEKNMSLNKMETFLKFNKKIEKTKKNLMQLLNFIKNDKKTIAGYGASGRGSVIMNYCGIGKNFLDYVVDDAPAKQGTYTPGNHLPIRSSSILKSKNKPDYVLVFAWPFIDEILKKNTQYLKGGGKFIIPLPKPKII